MARVRVRHDIRLEYVTSELPWSCMRGQQLGVVEAKRRREWLFGSPASRSLRSCERTWFTEELHADVAMTEVRFYDPPGRSVDSSPGGLDDVGD